MCGSSSGRSTVTKWVYVGGLLVAGRVDTSTEARYGIPSVTMVRLSQFGWLGYGVGHIRYEGKVFL